MRPVVVCPKTRLLVERYGHSTAKKATANATAATARHVPLRRPLRRASRLTRGKVEAT